MSQNIVNMTFFTDNGTQNFFFIGVSTFSLYGSSFQISLVEANPCSDHLQTFFFYWNMLLSTHNRFFFKFHMVYTSQPAKIVPYWSTMDFLPFWIASKQMFCEIKTIFCGKPIPNNADFTFIEEKFFYFSQKKKKKKRFLSSIEGHWYSSKLLKMIAY